MWPLIIIGIILLAWASWLANMVEYKITCVVFRYLLAVAIGISFNLAIIEIFHPFLH